MQKQSEGRFKIPSKKRGAGVDKSKDIDPQVDWPIQLEYAEKLGLGTRAYELVKI